MLKTGSTGTRAELARPPLLKWDAEVAYVSTLIVLWTVLNIGFTVFNRQALSLESVHNPGGLGFNFPALYTGCHMIASMLGALLIMHLKPSTATLSKEQFRNNGVSLAMLGILFGLGIITNNASLALALSLSVSQIIKSCTPLPQLFVSYFMERKTFSWQVAATVVSMAVFAGLAIPLGSPNVPAMGITLAIISALSIVVKTSLASILLKNGKQSGLGPVTLVFYDAFFSFWVCLIYWLCDRREFTESTRFLAQKPLLGFGIIVAGSAMAMCYNIVVFLFLQATSSVTNTVLSASTKIGLIAVAAAASHENSALNWVMTVFFFGSFGMYCWLKLREGAQKKGSPAIESSLLKADVERSMPGEVPAKGCLGALCGK